MAAVPDHIADDLTPDDLRAFCKAHDVEFHAMGTPPGVDDTDGKGWDDTNVFRVATRPGMMGGSPRGVTVHLDKVREWKRSLTELSLTDRESLDNLASAAWTIGEIDVSMIPIVMEGCLRRAHARLTAGGLVRFNSSPDIADAVRGLDPRLAVIPPLDHAILTVRMAFESTGYALELEKMLRTAVLCLDPSDREAFLSSDENQKIVALGEELAAAPAPGI